jgi:hypothetical protein
MSLAMTILDTLGGDQYQARSVCLGGDADIVFLYLLADFFMSVSAVGIGWALIAYRGHSFQLTSRARTLCGVFMLIFAVSTCSRAANLFLPMYRLDVLLLATLSGVATATAWTLFIQLRGAKKWSKSRHSQS